MPLRTSIGLYISAAAYEALTFVTSAYCLLPTAYSQAYTVITVPTPIGLIEFCGEELEDIRAASAEILFALLCTLFRPGIGSPVVANVLVVVVVVLVSVGVVLLGVVVIRFSIC